MPKATEADATHTDVPTTVAGKLRWLLDLPGNAHTQAQLADYLTEVTGRKRHRGYIANILNGKILRPRPEDLEALALKLGIEPHAAPYFFTSHEVSAAVAAQVDLITHLRDGGLREVALTLLTKVDDDDIPAVIRTLRALIAQRAEVETPEPADGG